MRYGIQSRLQGVKERNAQDPIEKKRARERRIKFYTLMVYEDADATLLRLFECFMESAPQLILQVRSLIVIDVLSTLTLTLLLQIYILIKDPGSLKLNDEKMADNATVDIVLKDVILIISVVSSLFSLAWSLVVYHRSLRYTFPGNYDIDIDRLIQDHNPLTFTDKENLDFKGSLFQFLWHFLSITARVLALSLFASIYPKWIGPACVGHWVLMSTWVAFQNTKTCKTKVSKPNCVYIIAPTVVAFFAFLFIVILVSTQAHSGLIHSQIKYRKVVDFFRTGHRSELQR